MVDLNASEITIPEDDEVYPSSELEFLDKPDHCDPLVFKISEIIFRQCQKARVRKKQKQTARAYTLIILCLFLSLMSAIVVSTLLEDKLKNGHDHIFSNSTHDSSYHPILYASIKENVIPRETEKLFTTTSRTVTTLSLQETVTGLQNTSTKYEYDKESVLAYETSTSSEYWKDVKRIVVEKFKKNMEKFLKN